MGRRASSRSCKAVLPRPVFHRLFWRIHSMFFPLLPLHFNFFARLRVPKDVFNELAMLRSSVVVCLCCATYLLLLQHCQETFPPTLCAVLVFPPSSSLLLSLSTRLPLSQQRFASITHPSLLADICQLLTDIPPRTFAAATYRTHFHGGPAWL